MGILNVTPDSFSDGGQVKGVRGAVEHACTMVQQGADIIDIGGQSTRPGATRLTTEEEVQRVVPVIRSDKHNLPQLSDVGTCVCLNGRYAAVKPCTVHQVGVV